VMQAADLGQLDHLADLERHHRAHGGRVLLERQIRDQREGYNEARVKNSPWRGRTSSARA
jgi:hypothetical protein